MYGCERTISNICELCGNQSSLFTCQLCIITGNFWVGKANYSYGGKKKISQNLKDDKVNLQNDLAESYHSSCVYRSSIKKLAQNQVLLYKQRISDLKNKTAKMKEKSQMICSRIVSKKEKIEAHKLLLQKLKDKLSLREKSCTEKNEKLVLRKEVVKVNFKEYIMELNNNVFKIENNNGNLSVVNIHYKEEDSAINILKQLKGLQSENESVNSRVVMSMLVHFVNIASLILDSHLPFELQLNTFLGQSKTSKFLRSAIKQLDSNILYLCLSQHVHPELLEPYQYVSNLNQLLTSDSSCGIGPFCYSLDRPGIDNSIIF